MKYEEFRKVVEKYPVFGDWVFELTKTNPKSLRNNITDWIKKGYVIRLKQGLYTLRDKDRNCRLSSSYLANQIYSPSYISLEYALQFYNLIPERVNEITSVTTKKTAEFSNSLGRFTYAHIKTELFSDYLSYNDSGALQYLIASPEKALLDFIYFKVRKVKNIEANIFESSYRMQNLEDIDCTKLIKIAQKYKMRKVVDLANTLVDYIQEEWK
ncbi:MAG: hypothetical protein HOA17_01910 [Candidatus Melainabacteria bacterium]|mgnify:CR=1 FL=1|jgi:hypothetical protein|nr:hypothetical protein [Candidatus Melainabacteria bacterium]